MSNDTLLAIEVHGVAKPAEVKAMARELLAARKVVADMRLIAAPMEETLRDQAEDRQNIAIGAIDAYDAATAGGTGVE